MTPPFDRGTDMQGGPNARPMTSSDAFDEYRLRCGGIPVLSHPELRVEVQTAGLRYEDLDESFWATLFRRPDHRHLE